LVGQRQQFVHTSASTKEENYLYEGGTPRRTLFFSIFSQLATLPAMALQGGTTGDTATQRARRAWAGRCSLRCLCLGYLVTRAPSAGAPVPRPRLSARLCHSCQLRAHLTAAGAQQALAVGGHCLDPAGALRMPSGCPRWHLALRGGAGCDGESVGGGRSGNGEEGGEEGGMAMDFDPVSIALSPARACGANRPRDAWREGRDAGGVQ